MAGVFETGVTSESLCLQSHNGHQLNVPRPSGKGVQGTPAFHWEVYLEWEEPGLPHSLLLHRGSPSICFILFESPSSIKHPCILAADTLLRAEFCPNAPSDGHAQVTVTFVLGVLVYGLFNYTQSLKHLHNALKYSRPFLFNFIFLLVFGDYPAKHSVNSIKFIPQLIQSPMTMEASPL